MSSTGARHPKHVAGLIYLDASTGAYDEVTRRWLKETPEFPGRFARGLPRATVVLLPNATHYASRSNPDDVLNAMRAFIDRLN